MTTNEPETDGGKFLRDSLNANVHGSVSSLEAAFANMLNAKAASLTNDNVDANGRPLND